MSYRPICDVWILARPKIKFYGAYPSGFLERARRFMPCRRTTPVLHACGGSAKFYRDAVGPAWKKLCPNDVTCDLDAAVEPDLVWNVRTNGIPSPMEFVQSSVRALVSGPTGDAGSDYGWRGIIIDPPYTPEDAAHYAVGADELPNPRALVCDSMEVLAVGGRVGILHYVWPRPPAKGVKCIACIGVIVGYGNRMRVYSVFEKE